MKVSKFGSATIATADKIKDIARIVSKKNDAIVVLSSIKGTAEALEEISSYFYTKNTEEGIELLNKLRADYNELITNLFVDKNIAEKAKVVADDCFNYVKSFSKDLFTLFEERALMGQGEIISSEIFFLYLQQENIAAVLLPALDFMRTDRNMRPDQVFIKENLNILMQNQPSKIYITQGYITRNAYGEVDDLRKGGSDFTAALIGAAVKASEIQIWEDVDVMQNNDPKYVEETHPVRQISFDEAAELAYFGAEILHPTRISPAKIADIPVRLKSTQTPDEPGTLISNAVEKNNVKAVVVREGIVSIRVSSGEMLLAHGFLRRVLEIFERYHTPVDMLTTSEVAISVTIDDHSKLEYIVDDLKRYGKVETKDKMAMISVVGDLAPNKTAITAEIIRSVENIDVQMISYGGSELNLSLLINERDVKLALNQLNICLF